QPHAAVFPLPVAEMSLRIDAFPIEAGIELGPRVAGRDRRLREHLRHIAALRPVEYSSNIPHCTPVNKNVRFSVVYWFSANFGERAISENPPLSRRKHGFESRRARHLSGILPRLLGSAFSSCGSLVPPHRCNAASAWNVAFTLRVRSHTARPRGRSRDQ